MIFDDNYDVLNCIRYEVNELNKDSRDNDPEITRMFATSPPTNINPGDLTSFNDNSLASSNKIDSVANEEEQKKKSPSKKVERVFALKSDGNMFERVEVPSKPVECVSGITKFFAQNAKNALGKSSSNSDEVTIYLPDRQEMTIAINYTNAVGQVIRNILKAHKKEGLQPPLIYDQPELYELRLHEGDGLPDEDFELEPEKQLVEYGKETEYCLCDMSDDDFVQAKKISQSIDDDSDIERESLMPSTVPSERMSIVNNQITVFIAHMGTVVFPVEDGMTLRDLLLKIAKKHRLRIYRVSYEFVISQDERERLKLAFPLFELDTCIQTTGLREVELRRKIYVDAPKIKDSGTGGNVKKAVPVSALNRTESSSNATANTSITNISPNLSSNTTRTYTEKYNDNTAAIYEEWNVIKKNKFGIRQERVFGIDGNGIYNTKRKEKGQADRNNVRLAQRDLGDVIKFERIEGTGPDANKSFRITWQEDNIQYVIEYQCENERDCSQILNKLQFLMNKRRKNTI